MDYTGLNYFEIDDLPIDTYLGLCRDSFIYSLNKTEKGRKYLEDAWILEQTEPDRKALRENFGNNKRKGGK